MAKNEVVNLLWTSGWDSTYRLMDLILKGKTVQPHYLSFKQRKSTWMELRRMEEMKVLLQKKGVPIDRVVLPTEVIDAESIQVVSEIKNCYKRLIENKVEILGDQYIQIASYARNNGIKDLELSIHADDRAYSYIKDDVELIRDGEDSYYKMTGSINEGSAEIFKYLTFPLLDLTKLEMEKDAKKRGFNDVLEKTWFCHTPTKKGEPCGTCAPCIFTVEEGLGRRLPIKSRVKAKPAKILRVIKRSLTN